MEKYIFGERLEEDLAQAIPSALPADPVPTMAYVPLQFFGTLYETLEGYSNGTIFPELDKPFTGCDMK